MSILCVSKDMTAEPIWFFFTVKHLIGPGKVYNFFKLKLKIKCFLP